MVEALQEIFKPVREVEELTPRVNYRKITVLYLCSATEEQEVNCTGFLAGQDGRCCYRFMYHDQKICSKE